MHGLDTNVLVRYLVSDDKKQAARAKVFIEKHCTDEHPGFINVIVLCELTWVLAGAYKQSRAVIYKVIDQLLATAQLEIMDADLVLMALKEYKDSKAQFADHLIAHVNAGRGHLETITFDQVAAKTSFFKQI
ncbi:MAG: type II toxin-antitoxin system VapC family toxin [Gammaproteobacteria bacterium]|nr:type II toxin-antitoxin system VapC family toxin [Gammaproteobacteria bacterium]